MRIPLNGWNKCFLCLGTVLMVLGLISITCLLPLLDYIVKTEMQLKAGTKSFEEWQLTRPITMDIYIYNWTNPEEIYDPNTKPNLVEVGPYRFKHVREKVNITWNTENDTITYQNKLYYYYDEDSPRNYSDVVTTFNIVAWAVAHQTKNSNIFIKQGARLALLFSKLHTTTTVRELLFEGYEDPLISTVSSMSFLTGDRVPDRVGLFYGRNLSVGLDGVQNVHIKLDDEYGSLKYWNYKNTNPFYEGQCAQISGSAGEFYPMNAKPDHINYFATDLCRGLQFNYEKNHTVNGIFTYKYTAGKEIFDNGTTVKENKCYCKGNCVPSGVIDMSSCKMGLPVYTSLPHFYNGDPSYISAVKGLLPEKEKHEFYFALEPKLGIIADTAARIQMNLLVQPVPGYGLFEGVPEIMFPVFWTENKVPLYDDYSANVLLLLNVPEINRVFSITLIVLGAICIVYVVLFITCYKNNTHKKPPLKKEEVPLTSSS